MKDMIIFVCFAAIAVGALALSFQFLYALTGLIGAKAMFCNLVSVGIVVGFAKFLIYGISEVIKSSKK